MILYYFTDNKFCSLLYPKRQPIYRKFTVRFEPGTAAISVVCFSVVVSLLQSSKTNVYLKICVKTYQGLEFAHSLIAHLLIHSFRSNQMSDCERFAQITQDK